MRKLVYSPTRFAQIKNSKKRTVDLCVRKTNPTVILQRNGWQIRQGVKYFMRDVTFGANSSVYTPAIPEDTET